MNTGQIRFGNENSSLGLEINMKVIFQAKLHLLPREVGFQSFFVKTSMRKFL